MVKYVLGWGATKRETGKDIENAGSSTEPEITLPDIDEAESSTRREIKPDIDETESSTRHEITEHSDGEFNQAEIISKMKTKIVIKLGASPKLLRKGKDSCCIFRIPQTLTRIHHKGYEPEIVSIGPYHHKKEHLQMIEEHKHRFLELFIREAEYGVTEDVLGEEILKMETAIRNSYYDGLVTVDQPNLLAMMLLDGCFILMLFFLIAGFVTAPDDPILTTPWIITTIRRDLLLLENQVPFNLLKTLLRKSKLSTLDACNMGNLAFKFFAHSMFKKEGSWNLEAKHLLDLIRGNFIPNLSSNGSSGSSTDSSSHSRLIHSAKRLRLQGIEFKASHDHSSSKVSCKKMIDYLFNESNAFVPRTKTILEIKLNGNELCIPPILFDGFISSVLLNCVAFEQLSMKSPNNITSYVVFMGCLMNDEADATYLSEKGIIESYFGSGSDVSQFFKKVCKDVAFDLSNSYLKEEFKGINKYTSNRWNVECARFKHLHFDSPWTLISSVAVLVAILLAIVQATFGGLSYLRPPK